MPRCSAQIILDRLKEARHSFGTEGFGEEIRTSMMRELFAYRRTSARNNILEAYLVANSLQTKVRALHWKSIKLIHYAASSA
jgi:hypothetical protein